MPVSPLELLALDSLLSDEERDFRDVVRRAVDEHVRPHVAQWFEEGRAPTRELAKQFGALGVLGMHLHGYGCAGASAVAYGLTCLELEAGDSGLRSLVSVQGSLAMFAIWKYGSDAQKDAWLPAMATGDAAHPAATSSVSRTLVRKVDVFIGLPRFNWAAASHRSTDGGCWPDIRRSSLRRTPGRATGVPHGRRSHRAPPAGFRSA